MSTYRIQATSVEAPQFSGSFIGDGSGLTGIGGSTPTGSLLTTASFTTPNLTFTKGDSSTFDVNISSLTGSLVQSSQTSSFVLNSQTSSMSVLSSSYALSSSIATSSSYANRSATLDLYSITSASNSYILFSNLVAATGQIVGGNTNLRYNSSTNVLTVGNISATNLTGSLLGTASWATNALTASLAPNYILTSATASMLSPYVLSSQTSSFVQNSQTSSFTTTSSFNSFTASINSFTSSYNTGSFTGSFTGSLLGTSSWATNALTSSYAVNGGVTQIIAGTNVTISPTNGLGQVTINSTGGGGSGGAGANVTGSFTNQSTWTFTHGLNNRAVVVQTYDTNWNQTIPQNITLTNNNTATITFPTAESGYAIATLGGITTSSVSSSFAATASYVNTLNQSVNIAGDVTASIFAATNNGSGTNFKVGDDAWIGDINAADTLQVRGQQNGGKGYIKFGTGSSNPIIGSSGTSVLEIQNGYIQMPSRPAFRVTGSSSTNITATTTLTSTQVGVDYNQGNYYTASSGIFTAPVSGLYNVYMNIRVGNNVTSNQAILYKNDTTPMLMWETTTNTGAVHFGVSGVIYLALNDNLRVKVTVGTIQFDGNDSWGATYIG